MRYMKHDSAYFNLKFPFNMLAAINKDDLYKYPEKTEDAASNSIRFDRESREYYKDKNFNLLTPDSPFRVTRESLEYILSQMSLTDLETIVVELHYKQHMSLSEISRRTHHQTENIRLSRNRLLHKIRSLHVYTNFRKETLA